MREIDEDELAEVVVTIEVPRLEDDDTDIGCVTLFGANSDIEDVVELESVDTTIVSGVEDILLRATCLIAETIELSFPKDPRGTYPDPNLDLYRQRPLAQS